MGGRGLGLAKLAGGGRTQRIEIHNATGAGMRVYVPTHVRVDAAWRNGRNETGPWSPPREKGGRHGFSVSGTDY